MGKRIKTRDSRARKTGEQGFEHKELGFRENEGIQCKREVRGGRQEQ